jgi:hypothetical protein
MYLYKKRAKRLVKMILSKTKMKLRNGNLILKETFKDHQVLSAKAPILIRLACGS